MEALSPDRIDLGSPNERDDIAEVPPPLLHLPPARTGGVRYGTASICCRQSVSSEDTGYPSIDLASVGDVLNAEARFEPALVTQHAAMKPCGARGKQEEREP